MGDIADEHYDRMMDEGFYGGWCGRRRLGGDTNVETDGLRREPECNRCGFKEVHWKEAYKTDGSHGWRLFNDSNNRPHLCGQAAPSADAFDVVPE